MYFKLVSLFQIVKVYISKELPENKKKKRFMFAFCTFCKFSKEKIFRVTFVKRRRR